MGALSASSSIVVRSLTKRFGDRVAFQDLTFEVGAGEIFGFLGPNGAGKTTTVRVLGTLIESTSGSAEVAGIPVSRETGPELRGRIAIMPENPGLYLRLTVQDNLEFFAGLYGIPPSRARELIPSVLDALDMAARAHDPAGSLSKGLRQRVALARALLPEPLVLFLDEPTAGLDPVATREVRELIDGLRRRGVTVFLTTHRLEEAERLCDRIAIVNTTLRSLGSPDQLRRDLFSATVEIRTARPLSEPGAIFDPVPGVTGWRANDRTYLVSVDDASFVAPELARRLVGAGADILKLAEAEHTLEDVYLELVHEDVEVHR